MTQRVTDSLSHAPNQVNTAVESIGTSKYKRAVFERVCFEKRKKVNLDQIVDETGLPRQQLLNAANSLVADGVIEQEKQHSTIYIKNCTLCKKRKKILSLAENKKKAKNFRSQYLQKENKVIVKVYNKQSENPTQINIEDLDQFKKIKNTPNQEYMDLKEEEVKDKIMTVLSEQGEFKDWGGEFYDLSTYVRINGKRLRAVFGLKGRGKKIKKLRLKDMGTNGDQIDRMFLASAQVFFVQFVGQVGEDIYKSLETNARSKSFADGRTIYYGVIDGNDTARLFMTF